MNGLRRCYTIPMPLNTCFHLALLVLLLSLACAASAAPTPAPVRVMTFNIRYGTADDGANSWRFRQDKTAQVIKDYAPDIIGTQEMLSAQRSELLELLPRYGAWGVGRDDGVDAGEQCCVLYDKARFIVTAGGTFWLSEAPGVPGSVSWDSSLTRVCTWVRLYEPATQRGFYVFDAHFDHQGETARLRSAELVLARIAARELDEPVIFMGDLNCGEGSAPVELLSARLSDSYRAIHPGETAVRTHHAFTGAAQDDDKIDYIFVDGGWLVDDATIAHDSYEGQYPSDHFPVVATLRLKD